MNPLALTSAVLAILTACQEHRHVPKRSIEAVRDGDTSPLTPDPEASPTSDSPVGSNPLMRPSLSFGLGFDKMRAGTSQKLVSSLSPAVKNASFRYELERANGKDPGTVAADGVYTAPSDADADLDIKVTSIWRQDETLRATASFKLVPAGTLLVECAERSSTFPIVAEVFDVPNTMESMPDFNAISASKVFTRCLDQVNIASQDNPLLFPNQPDLNASFALRVVSIINIPAAGTYELRLVSDDGSKLYLDNTLLINNDGLHGPTAIEVARPLSSGDHAVTLEYYQGGGGMAFELSWRMPGEAEFVPIPAWAYR